MATKKQKRLAALEKRAKFEADERARGLEFQEKDRKLRELKRKQADAQREKEKHDSTAPAKSDVVDKMKRQKQHTRQKFINA